MDLSGIIIARGLHTLREQETLGWPILASLGYACPPCLPQAGKGGLFLILAGQTEEEPTLCKNHPSAELRAGPSAPVKHAGRKKRVPVNGTRDTNSVLGSGQARVRDPRCIWGPSQG
jgi:hypothetical protein